MNPALLAPIITGAFGLASGIANHFSNRSLSNNAFRQNLKMWNLQNQYNSPSSQVSRLVAAGLNPALAYGGSSQVVGNSETPPQLDYSGVYHTPLIQPDAIMQAQQALTAEYARQKTQSEIEKNAAETIESLNRGKLSGAEAHYAEDYAVEKLRSMRLLNDQTYQKTEEVQQNINNLIATRNLTKEQIRALELQNELSDRVMEAKVFSYELQNRESIARSRELYARVAKYRGELSVLSQQARNLAIQNTYLPTSLTMDIGKSMTSIQKMNKEMLQIDSAIEKMAVDTGIAEKELKNWFWTHIFIPEDQAASRALTGLVGSAAIGLK